MDGPLKGEFNDVCRLALLLVNLKQYFSRIPEGLWVGPSDDQNPSSLERNCAAS